MSKQVRLITVALGMVMSSAAFATGPYSVTAQDQDLKMLVTRWAAHDGKALVWESPWNAHIKNPTALNAAAKLDYVTSTSEAFTRLDDVIKQVYETDEVGESHVLVACMFDDKLVIRSIYQPPCSVPLPAAGQASPG